MSMKVIAVLVVVGVVALGGFMYFRSEQLTPSERLAAVATITETAATATATTIKKNLYLTPVGREQAEDIPDFATVSSGDLLTTSHDGRGLVTMQNGSTAILDYDSSMTIKSLDDSGKRASLHLIAGSVWARVEKVFGKGEYLEIKTQNAVAVVRGTSFGLSYRKDGSVALLVSQGTVSLAPLDPTTGLAQEEKARAITAGERGIVSPDGSLSKSAISASDASSEWFRYNNSESAGASSNTVAPASSPIPVPPPPPPPAPAPVVPQIPPPIRPVSLEDAGNICASFSEAEVGSLSGSSLKLSGISPTSISQSSSGLVTLTGEGFNCVTTIMVGEKVLTGESDFTVVDNSNITFSSNLVPIGTFNIIVADTLGATATLRQTLTATR